ncbi:Bacteriocin-protection, YdeI or OmpD-Associated [Candidatus Gugararchaeum adminiculabundum]|nr:Bacteriocin-protection, YdeI or OmpD-Associated [Candidatus Gugararchaeum adminiculabundum]
MKLGKTLYVTNYKAWRAWLLKNHAREKEVWLIYYKKSSGKPRISYNDAVDGALCFGWIDSIAKSMDDERFAQRFTPRRNTSQLSQLNKERILKLIAKKKMTKAGLAAVAHVFKVDDDHEKFHMPKYILAAIKKNEKAWANFQKLPESYKRIRIAYIKDRGEWSREQLRKSLEYFIKKTAENKRIGFVRE